MGRPFSHKKDVFFLLKQLRNSENMKKNLFLSTAIVAASLCFADTAKAERIKHLGPTAENDPIVISGEVTGNNAADTGYAWSSAPLPQA